MNIIVTFKLPRIFTIFYTNLDLCTYNKGSGKESSSVVLLERRLGFACICQGSRILLFFASSF